MLPLKVYESKASLLAYTLPICQSIKQIVAAVKMRCDCVYNLTQRDVFQNATYEI